MAWKPAYAAVADLRTYLDVPAPGGSPTLQEARDTTNMTLALETASRSIDRYCGRQFGVVSAAVARLYTAEWNYVANAHEAIIDDVMTTTNMVVEASDVAVTDYDLLPLNAAGIVRPWTMIRFGESVSTTLGQIEVTALWGWTAVPDSIKNATLLQATRLFKRKASPFGIAGSPEMGSELRLLAKLDPDVAVMVADYRRRWGAV
jgi:hypothetical protein